jgi:putative membrane protein
MDAGWGLAMMLAALTLWALLAVAIAWFLHATRTSASPTTPSTDGVAMTAEQILAERLARGEIDPADDESRLTALKPSR